MPSLLDVSFAVLFAIVIVIGGGTYFDRRLKRQLADNVPDARRNWYRGTVIGEWILAALTVVLWSKAGRAWRALGFEPPTDWRLYVGIALAAIVAVFVLRQNAKVRALPPDRLQRLVPKFTGVESIVPRTPSEYQWFQAVSWTAGVCEELLYRGFLTWLVAAYAGPAAALVIVSVAFGLGHAYQGPKGIVKVSMLGVVFGSIVLASGWLIPAMFIHAMIDLAGGTVGFAVLGQGARRLAAD